MKIKEIVCEVDATATKPVPTTIKKIDPATKTVTVQPTGGGAEMKLPIPPSTDTTRQVQQDPNNPNKVVYTMPGDTSSILQPGKELTVQFSNKPGQTVAEDHDDLESKSDRELMKIAREQDVDEDEFRIIDGELVNRDDIIILIRGDIKGGDETDSLITQVTDPLYGYHALSEIRALAGIK